MDPVLRFVYIILLKQGCKRQYVTSKSVWYGMI